MSIPLSIFETEKLQEDRLAILEIFLVCRSSVEQKIILMIIFIRISLSQRMDGLFVPPRYFCAIRKERLLICIAINEDITKYTEFERVLQSKMQIPSDASTNASLGKGNVNDMLDYLISQAQLSIGKNTALMTKEDKIAYIHFLDEHGAFLITKSGQRICEALSISKYTLYNYLEISREVAKKN